MCAKIAQAIKFIVVNVVITNLKNVVTILQYLQTTLPSWRDISKHFQIRNSKSKQAIEVVNGLCSIFKQFGCPHILHSDNGGEFVSHVTEILCSKLNIKVLHGRLRISSTVTRPGWKPQQKSEKSCCVNAFEVQKRRSGESLAISFEWCHTAFEQYF